MTRHQITDLLLRLDRITFALANDDDAQARDEFEQLEGYWIDQGWPIPPQIDVLQQRCDVVFPSEVPEILEAARLYQRELEDRAQAMNDAAADAGAVKAAASTEFSDE